MISRRNKGTRRTRVILGLLAFILIAACVGIYGGRLFAKHHRENIAMARIARESVEREQAARATEIETVRKNLPPEAAPVRDWTLRKTAEACRPLKDTDLKLLDQLAQYYFLYSDPNRPQGLLNQIRTQVEAAVASKTATPFENEISQYLDSQDGMLLCASRYLEALPLLREAEQALTLGLFTLPASEWTLREMPSTLAALTCLRGLGELKTGEPRRALLSALHAYDFMRDGWDPDNRYMSNAFGYADRLIEQVTDDVWPDVPYTLEEREKCLAAIGWHPSAKQLTDALFIWVATRAESFYSTGLSAPRYRNLLQKMLFPIRNAGIYERAHELAPLLGGKPFETAAQMTAIQRRIPQYALATDAVISTAIHCNTWYAYRSLQADVARVAFELKDYQREHGAYPATLEGMAPNPIPALPLEPHSGKPCEYRSDTKTFTIVRLQGKNEMEVLWNATK